MYNIARQGAEMKHRLTARDVAEIEALAARCNAHEHLLMRLDYNLLAYPMLPTDDFFLYYQDDELIGCLLLDRYHVDVKEVIGMVDPAFRRQHIFTHLLNRASQECRSRGITRLLLICETTSTSGLAYLKDSQGGAVFQEHRMVLRYFKPRLAYDQRLIFREAASHDIDDLAIILAEDLESDLDEAREYVQSAWARPNQRFYIATYSTTGSDLYAQKSENVPVGMLRVEEMPREMGLYGFFVRAEYRRRSYGRQMLEKVIATIRAQSQKPIMLEVDANNFTALNLYRSCGFVVERTYGYYELKL